MTTTRSRVTIDGDGYELSDTQDLDALRSDLVKAHHDAGFVAFDVRGGKRVFALVTASSSIHVTTSIEPNESSSQPVFVAFDPDYDL